MSQFAGLAAAPFLYSLAKRQAYPMAAAAAALVGSAPAILSSRVRSFARGVAAEAVGPALTLIGGGLSGLTAASALSSLVSRERARGFVAVDDYPRILGPHAITVRNAGEEEEERAAGDPRRASLDPEAAALLYTASKMIARDSAARGLLDINWAGIAAAGAQVAGALGVLNAQQAQAITNVAQAIGGGGSSPQTNASSTGPLPVAPSPMQQPSSGSASAGNLTSILVPVAQTVAAALAPRARASQAPGATTVVSINSPSPRLAPATQAITPRVAAAATVGEMAGETYARLRSILGAGDALAAVAREYPDFAWAVRYARYRVNGGSKIARDASDFHASEAYPRYDATPACRDCSNPKPWARDARERGIKSGRFFASQLVTAEFSPGGYQRSGVHGEIRLGSKPFRIVISGDQADTRIVYALSHELVHLADFLYKCNFTHAQVHALGIFFVDVWAPVMRAAMKWMGK